MGKSTLAKKQNTLPIHKCLNISLTLTAFSTKGGLNWRDLSSGPIVVQCVANESHPVL